MVRANRGRQGNDGGDGRESDSVGLLQRRGTGEAEILQSGSAATVGGSGGRAPAQSGIEAHQCTRGLFARGLGAKAVLPRLHNRFGAGPPEPSGAVTGQGQARLLASRLQTLPGPVSPFGIRFVAQQRSVGEKGLGQRLVPVITTVHDESELQRSLMTIDIDFQESCMSPDLVAVGLQQARRRLAQAREGRPGQ